MNPAGLPRRLEDLRGLRAARWLRESSARQQDKYGPGAQRTMQDRAIERYGLLDTGRSWMVLKSGWSGADSMEDPPATRTIDFQTMLRAAEAGLYDVLLVGYTSRFLRDLQLALHYRRFFHRAGVVILICDDKILTSDPDDWERLVDKLTAAEVYSRDLARNIRSGLAEKRRSKGDPGGQPPLGYRRDAAKLLTVDEAAMPTVHRTFELSAAGQPDHEVAATLGLTVHTVRHVLRNPIYLGRLTDGQGFHLGAEIDMNTWNLVQSRREARRTRVPGIAQRRCYALKLSCASCGLPLHGHNARHRHAAPVCDAFREARPTMGAVRGRHGATAGDSYPQAWYEALVGRLLEEVGLVDDALVERVAAGLAAERGQTIDQLALARIARARSEATRRLEETRDVATWQATMRRLDAEEAAAREPALSGAHLDGAQIRSYIRNLGALWRDSDDRARQGLALALLDEIAVLGFRELRYRWSAAAIRYGLDRIVPPEMTLPLEPLGLAGEVRGEIALRALDAVQTGTRLERAG